MDKDKIFSTYIDTDIASLYPKRCYIPYENMYELERIRKTMKKGSRVTRINPTKNFCGKIGTIVDVKIEHDYGSRPTATVEVVFDDSSSHFGFDPNALALIDTSKLEEHIVKSTVPGIKKVIYSSMKTIILWDDNTKTIVSCREGDIFDPYMGFCAAVMKKLFGSTSKIKKTIKEKACGRDDIDIFLD